MLVSLPTIDFVPSHGSFATIDVEQKLTGMHCTANSVFTLAAFIRHLLFIILYRIPMHALQFQSKKCRINVANVKTR